MDTATTGDINIPADIAATLVDPVAYADDRIHDSYRWLRANNPLGIAQPEKFDPFWVVTKHAHIQAISRQNDLFHNADRPTTLTNRALEERVRKITGSPNLVRSLVQMDAPDHPKYRALTQGWFMPNNLGKFEGRVREIARATVRRMLDRGGACRGIAFRVAARLRHDTIAYLRAREQTTNVYREVMRSVWLENAARDRVSALAYVVDRGHVQYAGRLSLAEQQRLVLQGYGRSGNNRDYVLSTVAAIEKQGLRDAQLHQLAAMLHDAGPLHRDARAADDVDPN